MKIPIQNNTKSQKMNKDPLKEFITERGIEGFKRYYGTYLGIVVSVDDPQNRNRVLVSIPEIFGYGPQRIWAISKGVFSGKGYGYNFVPKVKETVWVTFRNGEVFPGSALWEPGHYAENEKPSEFTSSVIGYKYRDGALSIYNEETHELKLISPNGDTIIFKDDSFTIISKAGPRFTIDSDGVKLAGHGSFENAVLGNTLKSTLSLLITQLISLVAIVLKHDPIAGGGDPNNPITLTAISTQLTTIQTTLDTILAT